MYREVGVDVQTIRASIYPAAVHAHRRSVLRVALLPAREEIGPHIIGDVTHFRDGSPQSFLADAEALRPTLNFVRLRQTDPFVVNRALASDNVGPTPGPFSGLAFTGKGSSKAWAMQDAPVTRHRPLLPLFRQSQISSCAPPVPPARPPAPRPACSQRIEALLILRPSSLWRIPNVTVGVSRSISGQVASR